METQSRIELNLINIQKRSGLYLKGHHLHMSDEKRGSVVMWVVTNIIPLYYSFNIKTAYVNID